MSILMTSLNEIYSFNPCADGWNTILAARGATAPNDELFPLKEALSSKQEPHLLQTEDYPEYILAKRIERRLKTSNKLRAQWETDPQSGETIKY
jgi:hypothetical protein